MKQRAFTLLELVIVLAILSVLVAVVALSIGELPAIARWRAMQTEKGVVQAAIDAYNTQNVAVEGAPAIAASPVGQAVQPGPDSQPDFGRYLKRMTAYYYTWEAGGEGLAVLAAPEDLQGPE